AIAYLREAAMMDLRDLEHNTKDGVHIASLAGTWLALVAGFGGLRDHGGRLTLHPQLPDHWDALTFRLRWREAQLKVSVRRDGVTYELIGDDVKQLDFVECDETVTVKKGKPLKRPLANIAPLTPRPEQPAGRPPTVDDDDDEELSENPPDRKVDD
ncbi:MAG TPA: glycosyl hydrolase family 65 protein, partial [Jatrophihabitantaceae bacterium]|nr:glycosyl hydrolase family 65 protein [Jatrophihabitantaceae bacterium]